MKNNTKNKNQGLQVISLGNVPAVPNILEILKEELKGLKEITETSYKTEGNVDGFNNNIQEETKVENLVMMHSSVMARQDLYNRSQSELSKKLGRSLEVPVFKVSGYTPEAIEADILLRIQVINVSERKAELEALLKEGEAFLTKEDQYQIYTQKVAKLANRG